MGKDRKGMKYTILSEPKRAEICSLKLQGKSCLEISEMLKVNYKTIQSVNKPQKNQEYLPLMTKIEEMAYQLLNEKYDHKDLEDKRLCKLIRKIAKDQSGPQSRFIALIPPNKINSQKRRIIQQIVANVLKRLRNNEFSNQEQYQVNAPDPDQGSSTMEQMTIEEPELFHYQTELQTFEEGSFDIFSNSLREFGQISNDPSSQEIYQQECEIGDYLISYWN